MFACCVDAAQTDSPEVVAINSQQASEPEPVAPAPEPVALAPEPEKVVAPTPPAGVPVVFLDEGKNERTVYVTKKPPLGLRFTQDVVPIVVVGFNGTNTHGEEIGVKIGWEMVSFGGRMVDLTHMGEGKDGYMKARAIMVKALMATKKALIVSTSATQMGDHTTGAWSEEICGPYYVFKDAGLSVTVCSILGGDIPIDAGSLGENFKTENDTRMEAEGSAPLKGTPKLADQKIEDYDIVFFAGGHGTCTDFPTDEVGAIVKKASDAGKVMAAVCHGPMCFAKAGDVVKGKKMACFTDVEEGQVGLTEKVPFLLEAKMKELGALVEIKDPWNDNAVRDGNLVTGQNPQSSVSVAKLCIA